MNYGMGKPLAPLPCWTGEILGASVRLFSAGNWDCSLCGKGTHRGCAHIFAARSIDTDTGLGEFTSRTSVTLSSTRNMPRGPRKHKDWNDKSDNERRIPDLQ